MKLIAPAFLVLLCLTACSPRIGVGIGGVVASEDGIAASEVIADTQSGIHGSVSTGSDMRL